MVSKQSKQTNTMGMFSLAFFAIVLLSQHVHCDITFSSPSPGTLYAIGSQVTATLSGFTSGSTTITQICGSTPQISHIISYPTISSTFTLPAGYYGICTYEAASLNPAPQPVSIVVANSVWISDPIGGFITSSGSSFPITVTYTPDTDPNPIFDVELDCFIQGVQPIVQKVEGNALTQQFYHVPSYYYGNCNLGVLNTIPSYKSSSAIGIQINQQLTLVTPKNGASLIIGSPFNVLVTSKDTYTDNPIDLQFTNDASQNIPAYINVVKSVVLDSTYFGADSLTILSTDPYLPPPPISITLKYGIEFTQSPVMIVGSQPFQLYLTTSATPAGQADQSVTVYLTCSSISIDQWNNIPLNQMSTLSVNNRDFQVASNCFFSTPSDNAYYYKALQAVKIYTSPNGGPVNQMTPEEQNGYAKAIALPPSVYHSVSVNAFEDIIRLIR